MVISPGAYAKRRDILVKEAEGRRERLMKEFDSDDIIYLQSRGRINRNSDINYFFDLNPNIKYLTAIAETPVALILEPGTGKYILFAPEVTTDDRVWESGLKTPEELKEIYGADEAYTMNKLDGKLQEYRVKGAKIHSLPELHGKHNPGSLPNMFHKVGEEDKLNQDQLIDKLTSMRMIKSPAEIDEIKSAMAITELSYDLMIGAIEAGMNESQLQTVLEGVYRANGVNPAFPPIVTVKGAVLHSEKNENYLNDGQLLLVDSGACSPFGYASDLTRTFPVSGKFTETQKDLYNMVLNVKTNCIKKVMAGESFKKIHMYADRALAQGLLDLEILKGNINDIIANGAHRLFFPHGLGHHIGLTTHDMGEPSFKDIVAGYNERKKSKKFGLEYLRSTRDLANGMVHTIEPGIYFIKELLTNPLQYKDHQKYINMEKAVGLIDEVSGIRIESTVVVTENGPEILGSKIPEKVEDLESRLEVCKKDKNLINVLRRMVVH